MKPSLPADISILPEHNRSYPWTNLQAWFMANEIEEKMLWKKSAEKQIMFVRDEFHRLFGDDLLETSVVATHTSKSIKLPVYQVVLKGDIVLTMRDNFHNWIISVESPVALEFPTDLFSSDWTEDTHIVYCEGFDADQVFPSYQKSKKKFTLGIYDEKNLYVFMFLLRQQMIHDGPNKTIENLRLSLERTANRLESVLQSKVVRDVEETLSEARSLLK